MIVYDETELPGLKADLKKLPAPFLLRKYESTAEDFEMLAEEDLRCEFDNGVLIVHSLATFDHEKRVIFLATILNHHVTQNQLGIVVSSNAVMAIGERRYCPDLSFLSTQNQSRIRGQRVVGPMDLVVEFLSSSTRDYDLGEKRRAYREGRVPEIWLIDAEKARFQADFLSGDRYESLNLTAGRFPSRVLPGLTIDVAWLWAEPLPNPLDCLRQATA